MKISMHGIKAIENREGIRFTVYRDTKGIPTVGVGHVCLPQDNLKVGDKITEAQCDVFLEQDLLSAENAITNSVTKPLTQNQFDALTSFIINIGVGGFKKSTVLKRLNIAAYTEAADAMMMWKIPHEIIGRRRTEVKQFLTPDV